MQESEQKSVWRQIAGRNLSNNNNQSEYSCLVLDRERQELLLECYYWSKENVDCGGRLVKRPIDPEQKDLILKCFFPETFRAGSVILFT